MEPPSEKPLTIFHPPTKHVLPGPIRGDTNLMLQHGLQKHYIKYCEKAIKEDLSSFLPDISGSFDYPLDKPTELNSNPLSLQTVVNDALSSSLMRTIQPLTNDQLNSFRLYPTPLNEQMRAKLELEMSAPSVNAKKKKRKAEKEQKKQQLQMQQIQGTNLLPSEVNNFQPAQMAPPAANLQPKPVQFSAGRPSGLAAIPSNLSQAQTLKHQQNVANMTHYIAPISAQQRQMQQLTQQNASANRSSPVMMAGSDEMKKRKRKEKDLAKKKKSKKDRTTNF